MVQAHAADALAELCRDHQNNQTAVAEAGAITHLIDMLRQRTQAFMIREMKIIEQGKTHAAGALWRLSEKHFDNQTAVASADGIAPLVSLVGTGGDAAQVRRLGRLRV